MAERSGETLMDDGLPLDTQGMASGDPGAAVALEAGKQTTESKNIPTVASSKDYETVPHGSAYMDPQGQKRYKPIRNKNDYMSVEEGAEYADPAGKIRTKPRYEGIDFTPQTLYDIAHSDKGRKMALEKFYPGKVKEDPSGGFYIEDEDGKLRKPGRGATALTGRLAESAVPTILAGVGSAVGGALGTVAEPGIGTVAGGAAGAGVGGAYGTRFNQLISQVAGVYDPEGAAGDVAMGGAMSAVGDVGGRGIAAAAPLAKEVLSAGQRGASKAANKFLGTDPEALETGLKIAEQGEVPGAGPLGLSKPGTAVSPSAMFKSAPHVGNIAETLQSKFDATDTYLANAERYMDKKAKDILASKDIGAIVEGSVVHPKAAMPVEEAGAKIQESARLRAINESAEADRQLNELLEQRRSQFNKGVDPKLSALRPKEQVKATLPEAIARPSGEFDDFELPISHEGKNVGRIEFNVEGNRVRIQGAYVDSDVHGQGVGVNAYKKLVDWALSTGREVHSDAGVSAQAARMYSALERRGYNVVVNPKAEVNHLGAASAPGGPAFRITAGPSRIEKMRAEREGVVQTAERAKNAADNLVQQGFRDIERQANDAVRVAQVGHNAGDLWRTVAESFVNLRRSIGARANQMYTNAETASGGLVPPGAGELHGPAQQLLNELPEGFEAMHPTIVRRLRDMVGEVGPEGEVVREPTEATWVQLHNLRSQIRQDIKWNDLPSDIKNGTLKFLNNRINEVLHSVENQPELREASRLLTLADNFYRENMGPLNDHQIKSLVKALDSGLQADPKALLKVAIRDGKTEVANTIRNTVGPQTWDAMRAADVQDMLAQATQIGTRDIDGAAFAKQVLERKRNGVLSVLHGEQGAARLEKQAEYIDQLRGKLPIQPRPGDTANDIILRARSAAADAENLAKTDPLKAMQNEMRKVEAAAKKEFIASRKPDPLAFLTNSTVGANEAVNTILKDPDLIVAASRAFPGGEKSPEFQLMRQIWTQRFLSDTLEPGEKLAKVTPEIQALMFPGITLDDMHMLAKEMKLLISGKTLRGGGDDMGGSMMAQSAVENPFGRASGLGKLVGPMKILPGANFGARAALTAYYNGIRGLLTSPSTLRWLRKGLTSRDPVAKETARAELRAALQRGGAMGASAGESVYQGSND